MSVTRHPMDARIRARRREVIRDRVRRRRRLTLSAVVLVLLALAGGGLARSSLFAIVDVRVVGAHGEQADLVRDTARVKPGDNLLSADLRAAAGRVENLPWVREAEARRVPPSTVELRIIAREPAAVVRVPGATWLVDAEGVVIAGGAREGLVEITAPNSVVPNVGGQVRDAALRNALAAHAELPAPLRATVVRYEANSGRDLRLHLVDGVVVRFGAADQVDAKARSVELLLEQARMQAQRRPVADDAPGDNDLGVAEVDVRAPDNPVLVPASAPGSQVDPQ